MANDAALIFRIKGDASHVKKELSGLGMTASRTVGGLAQGVTGALNKDFSALSGGLSSLTGGLTALGPVGMAAGASLAAIGTAAMTAAGSIFALTKEAAAYGSKISDLMDKTGLGAEALTSLDYAAKLSGTSIDEVASLVTKFSKTIGEAASGSDEAARKLKFLGVDPQEAFVDLEGALGKVFARIQSLPPGVARTKAAIDAFGRSGANLLPLINTMNGDFDGLIQKAKEMGITFDDATAQDLDKFDDMLAQLTTQMGALTRQIGIAFLPVLSEMADEFSAFIKNNQEDIREFGQDVSGFVRLSMDRFKTLISYLKENRYLWEGLKASVGGALGMAALGAGREFNQRNPPPVPQETEEARAKRLANMEREMEEESRLREQMETRRLNALKETGRLEITQWRQLYQQKYNELLESYNKERITKEEFAKEDIAVWSRTTALIIGALQRQRAADLSNAELTAEERYNIELRYQDDVRALWAVAEEGERKRAAAIEQMDKIHAQRRIALVNYNYKRTQEIISDKLAKNLLQEQIYYEQGKKSAVQSAQAIVNLRKDALNEQIKDIDGLIATLSKEKEAEEDVKNLQLERARLIRQRDMISPLEEELQKVIRLKQEKQELRDLERELAAVKFELQQQEVQNRIADIESTIAKGVSYKIEKQLLEELTRLRQQSAQITLDRRLKELEDEKNAALERIKDKENEEEQKFKIEELYRDRRKIAEEEFQRRLKAIRDKAQGQGEIGKTIASEITTLKDALKKALGDIAGGLGQAVSAWVLYGETGGQVMRKVVAESLAALAQLAVVKVLTNLAEGFEALAMMNPGKAAMHFTAAKIWGAVGVGAAIGGRIVAGNSFRKEAGRETVSGAGRSSAPSGEQGKAYSSMNEQKVDMNRSASFGAVQRETVLVVKDKSGMFSKLFQVEIEKNSKVRSQLRTA